MKVMNIKLYCAYALFFFGIIVNAQQVLTTDEAVKLALEHNYGIKIANNIVEVAENNTGF